MEPTEVGAILWWLGILPRWWLSVRSEVKDDNDRSLKPRALLDSPAVAAAELCEKSIKRGQSPPATLSCH
jgi:hypothetical protein